MPMSVDIPTYTAPPAGVLTPAMVADYRASEGKTVEVPYRGPIDETVKDILGGLRSTCTYVGASALRELSKRTTFIRVMEQESRLFG